jgi:hypothetical protein
MKISSKFVARPVPIHTDLFWLVSSRCPPGREWDAKMERSVIQYYLFLQPNIDLPAIQPRRTHD